MRTYLFYDIETTGLNKAFDQVLHFAAIRTDPLLNEIERHDLKVKLNPDVVPAPGAMITHGIRLTDLAAAGVMEYEAIQQIHRWLNCPGTMSLGYNTLGFDDEFLRFSFYRNLLPPYHHQFKNQCSRLDIYPLALFYFLYKPDILQWPKINDKISFKLADIQKANALVEGPAHDAMVDVEATLQLARCFFQERKMWDYLTGYFDKKTDQERVGNLQGQFGMMLDGRLRQQNYQCPVLALGGHRIYKNQIVWLRLDTEKLDQTTAATIADTTMAFNKKWGEPNFVLPAKERFLEKACPEQLRLAAHNRQWLAERPEIMAAITEYYTTYQYPVYPETDASARLYLNGFWNEAEEKFCQLFHRATPLEKARLTATCPHPVLQTLALRVIGRHWPEAMSADQAQMFAQYLECMDVPNAIIDYQGKPRLDRKTALQEITVLQQQHAQHEGLLNELKNDLLSALDLSF